MPSFAQIRENVLPQCHTLTCTSESQSLVCVSMERGRLKWNLSDSSCWQEVELIP